MISSYHAYTEKTHLREGVDAGGLRIYTLLHCKISQSAGATHAADLFPALSSRGG